MNKEYVEKMIAEEYQRQENSLVKKDYQSQLAHETNVRGVELTRAWGDTGKRIVATGKHATAIGNFSDGGVKYIPDDEDKVYWMPRSEITFTGETI